MQNYWLQNYWYWYLEKYLWSTTFGFLWNLKNVILLSQVFVYSDWNILILLSSHVIISYDFKPQRASSVVFSIFPSFKNLFIHCSYFKTIVKFFERFHFGIILPVMFCRGMYNARYVITMNKSTVSQVGKLKIFPT